MMAIDASARVDFRNGDYAEAERKLKPIAERPGVDQPLFKLDLASVYLVQGKKDEAFAELMAAHRSIEAYFDSELEKKSASTWGRESSKPYKGDPYERGTLYFLLALLFLERGNPDNALAALKTGLLADSDTEKHTYKSDFAILQFLSAKCYDLRGEPAMRDQMLDAAFNSVVSFPAHGDWFAKNLVAAYRRAATAISAPRTRIALMKLCALGREESVEKTLLTHGVPAETAAEVAEWAKKVSSAYNPLDFNTLVLVWRGTPPEAVRVGRHGEKRVIRQGAADWSRKYDILVDGAGIRPPLRGFGDINYQAITRGGRKMDAVLAHQATYKTVTNTGGNAVIASAAAVRQPIVALSLVLAGVIMKITSAVMHPEADIRCWGNLPHSMDPIPLKLSPGTHVLTLTLEGGKKPRALRSEKVEISDTHSFNAVFFHPVGDETDSK